jgi:hypothetical protein
MDQSTTLELTAEELSLLAELLEQDYRELKEEINKTEGFRYKEDLKAREATMLSLLNKVTDRSAG